MVKGKRGIVFFVLVLVFVINYLSAEHIVTPTSFNIDEDDTTFFSISIENTDSGGSVEIKNITIVRPISFSFQTGSEGTDATASFTTSGVSVSWVNSSVLVNERETKQFWFSAIPSTPGNYNLIVTSISDSRNSVINLPVVVHDVNNPNASFGTNPVDDLESTTNSTTFNLKCTDNFHVKTLQLWGNWGNSWHAEKTNSSYVNNSVWSILVSNLDPGSYSWGVYCEDDEGNSDWTDENRTLHIAWDPKLGTPSGTGIVYTILDKDLTKGYKKKINLADQFKFLINDTYHTVKFIEMTNSTTKVDVTSELQRVVLSLSQSKKFELTGDNYYDLSVTLNSLDFDKKTAEFTLKSISEEIEDQVGIIGNNTNNVSDINNSNTSSQNNSGSSNNQFDRTGSSWFIIVGVIVVIAAIIGFLLYQMKRGYVASSTPVSYTEQTEEDQ